MGFTVLSSSAIEALKKLGKVREEHRFCRYHYLVDFPNSYTASVIKNPNSYGSYLDLFEVAVMRNGGLVYDTPITGDVVGFLDDEEVVDICERIAALSDD